MYRCKKAQYNCILWVNTSSPNSLNFMAALRQLSIHVNVEYAFGFDIEKVPGPHSIDHRSVYRALLVPQFI